MRIKLDIHGATTGQTILLEGRPIQRIQPMSTWGRGYYDSAPTLDGYEVRINDVQQMKKLRNALTKAIKEHEETPRQPQEDAVRETADSLAARLREHYQNLQQVENIVSQSQGTAAPAESPRRSAVVSNQAASDWWRQEYVSSADLADLYISPTGRHRVTGDGPSGSGHNPDPSGETPTY